MKSPFCSTRGFTGSQSIVDSDDCRLRRMHFRIEQQELQKHLVVAHGRRKIEPALV